MEISLNAISLDHFFTQHSYVTLDDSQEKNVIVRELGFWDFYVKPETNRGQPCTPLF